MAKIFPSLISANLLNLEKAIEQLKPYADGFHLDVMDDHFVPNLTWGPMFVNAIAQKTKRPLFVHLMVEHPATWPARLSLREGDTLAFHIENKINHESLIKKIKEKKWRVALAINPKTPLEQIFPFLPTIDQVLLMSVQPGFSGQSFLDSSINKLKSLVDYRREHNLNFEIVMDGGVDKTNIAQLTQLGTNQFGIASGIFGFGNAIENLKKLQALV